MGRQVETTGPEFTPTKGAVISVRAASVGKKREQGNGTTSFSGCVHAPGQTCGPIALAQGESILSPGGILSEQGGEGQLWEPGHLSQHTGADSLM